MRGHCKKCVEKSRNANINADPYGTSSNVDGWPRHLRSIKKYGDDAMRSKKFGSREPKKMAGGGKTGMRGQVKKDDMNKKAVNSAVKEAMDSKYEGKINPPKEPDGGVAKARMSRPTGPDRKEMAYNRRRSASEGRTVSKMAMGGKCRGMGAATKGGSFSKNG
jgi:hypothetical protein